MSPEQKAPYEAESSKDRVQMEAEWLEFDRLAAIEENGMMAHPLTVAAGAATSVVDMAEESTRERWVRERLHWAPIVVERQKMRGLQRGRVEGRVEGQIGAAKCTSGGGAGPLLQGCYPSVVCQLRFKMNWNATRRKEKGVKDQPVGRRKAFTLFRKQYIAQDPPLILPAEYCYAAISTLLGYKQDGRITRSLMSRAASAAWSQMTPEQKAPYEADAESE